MIKTKCRCGEQEKHFKIRLPFYIGECCEAAGYDEKGEKALSSDEIDALVATSLTPSEKIVEDAVAQVNAVLDAPVSKGKLKDMNVAALTDIATSKGIALENGATKKQIIAAILEAK
jgi:hypothetical protein